MLDHPLELLVRDVVPGLPLLGAVVAVLGWRRPGLVKAWTVIVVIFAGLTLWTIGRAAAPHATALVMSTLVVGAGLLAALAQPPDREAVPACIRILFFLGLGLGVLVSPPHEQVWWQGGVLGVLAVSCLGTMGTVHRPAVISAGLLVLGLGCLLLQSTMEGLWELAGLVWVALLLPLIPFHQPFATAVTRLPGAAPLLLAVLLPILGFQGLLTLAPGLPPVMRDSLGIVALLGIVIAGAKVFHQYRLSQALVYAHIAQLGVLWWFMVAAEGSGPLTPPAGLKYLIAVSTVMFGLYMSALQVRDRFGTLRLDQLRGLAGPMPRFSTVFVLLVTAAMGLPLFATFATLMDMLLQTAAEFRPGVIVLLLGWLLASSYFPLLLHRLLFGLPRKDLVYRDLRVEETLVGAMVLLILMLASVSPPNPPMSLDGLDSPSMARVTGEPWNP